MLNQRANRLFWGWAMLLAVAACGGRSDGDGTLVAAPPGSNTSVVANQDGQGGMAPAVTSLGMGGGSSDTSETGWIAASGGSMAATGATASTPVGGSTVAITAGGNSAVSTGGATYCPGMFSGGDNKDLISQALCGNGATEISNGEKCDDGNQLSGDGCSSTCGVEPSWNCPPGCSLCQRIVVCGNGVVEGSELCDDGVNSGAYGECNPDCTLAPRCGDGIVQSAYGEECDDGALNGTGMSRCTYSCKTMILPII